MLETTDVSEGAACAPADGAVDWREVDRQLRRVARRRAGLDGEEARWLVAAHRQRVHAFVGAGSFAEYIEHVLGYGPRVGAERLRVGRVRPRDEAWASTIVNGIDTQKKAHPGERVGFEVLG